MRKVELRMNEQEKNYVIKELVDHNGNKNWTAKKLGISRRQIDRLILKYKEKGKSGFVHGNRGHIPAKALDKSISENIILLYKNKYYDFNFNHFKKFLEKEENIFVSYKFIYNVLTKEGILSPKARKKTKCEYAKQKLLKEKKINLTMSDKQINTIVNHEVALEDSHPRGEKPKYFGEIIEQDGSIHLWFWEKKTCLHLAIDKATSTIVGAWFDYQETLDGYYHVLYQILTKYSIPYKFFTDNRTVFNYTSLNSNKRTSDKDVLTQYGYACKQLGIDLETSSVSQAKGLIERTNGTFQGRLVQELRLNIFLRYKNDIYKFLKSILNFGVKWHNLNFQAVYNKMTKFQDPNESRKKMSYYTYDKFKKFISYEEDLRWKCVFEILYYCGLRKGELKGLTWKDIYFNKKVLSVNKQITQRNNRVKFEFSDTKTRDSRRIVPMLNDLKILYEQDKKSITDLMMIFLWFLMLNR